MDIEQVARESPEAILSVPIDIESGIDHSKIAEVAEKLGFQGDAQKQAVEIITKLYDVL